MMRKEDSLIRGFTLIELLVVISIIAVLSSIVLASLSSARQNAVLAGGKLFEDNTYHALGDDVVAMWGFNEGSGNTTADDSGYGNTGTISASGVTHIPSPIRGNALNFSGGNVTVNPSPLIDTIGNAFTITAWINTTNANLRQMIYSAGYNPPSPGLGYEFNFGTSANTPGGLEVYFPGTYVAYTNAGLLPSNTWTQVAYTRNGFDTDTFYINGKVAPINTINTQQGVLLFSSNTTGTKYIGSRPDGTVAFSGSMDEIRIYAEALSISEIQKEYAIEAPKYALAVSK